MFVLYVVLADLWRHVGRYDLRPQAMCMRLARAMWVLWFERVWSWELPTLKKYILKKNLLDPRGSEMFFLYVVLADLWGHVGRYQKLALNRVLYTYIYIYKLNLSIYFTYIYLTIYIIIYICVWEHIGF